jgi:hypothetical protein
MYLHGVQVVGGSNPLAPTKKKQRPIFGWAVCLSESVTKSVTFFN